MTISSILPGNAWLSQVNQQGNTTVAGSSGAAAGGEAAGAHGNQFFLALTQALSQTGVTLGAGGAATPSGSSTGAAASSSTADPAQALAAFMHSLMAALHAENGQSASGGQAGADSDGDNDGSGAGAVHGHGRHHGNLQTDLQNLIQQLSAATDASSTSGTTGTSTSSSSTADPSLTGLEQSFQNLVGAFGSGSGTAGLQGFLQAFGNNLQGTALDGNVVSAKA